MPTKECLEDYITQSQIRLSQVQPERCQTCEVANNTAKGVALRALQHCISIEAVVEPYAEVIGECHNGLSGKCEHPINASANGVEPANLLTTKVIDRLAQSLQGVH